MINSCSKEKQDLMTIALFEGKQHGTYLELGGGDPIKHNNTYLLETTFNWRGVSIDMNQSLKNQWIEHRRNPCLHVNATTIDYNKLFQEHNLGTNIDFLQLDIDGDNTALNSYSFTVLKTLDLKKYHFGFLTFEHNYYLDPNNKERLMTRELLQDHGYTLLISDVKHKDMLFEDWYIFEELIPNKNWPKLQGDQIDMTQPLTGYFKEIIDTLNTRSI